MVSDPGDGGRVEVDLENGIVSHSPKSGVDRANDLKGRLGHGYRATRNVLDAR